MITRTTAEILQKNAGSLRLLLACISAVAVMGIPSTFASALSINNSQYTPGEVVVATCGTSDYSMQLFDITEGVDPSGSINLGNFECNEPPPDSIIFDGELGHTYALLELAPNQTCNGDRYQDCRYFEYTLAEVTFTIGDTSISSSGGGGETSDLRLGKSTYNPGETITGTCELSGHNVQVFDITEGVGAASFDIGSFPCDPLSISFESDIDRTYAAIEIAPNANCDGVTYEVCTSGNTVYGEVFFSVAFIGINKTSYPPVVVITESTSTKYFSTELSIAYAATDENNAGNQYSFYSMSDTPVNIYLIDTETFYSPVPSSYKTLLARDQPARGTFKWDVSSLVPGVPYRIVIDAIDKVGLMGQAVSTIFYVDFSRPEFTVTVEPSATRGAPVTISVDSTEELKGLPKVLVTQEGRTAGAVAMKGEGTHFEGTYTPINGYDGIAKISVSGVDLGGNTGEALLSGGTFAVGVNPPPAPKVTFPRNNDVAKVATTTLRGVARADTNVILTVNGTDTYTAKPDSTGSFTIPDIRLSKEKNRGVNTLSVVTKDSLGIVSSAATIRVRYNIAPTIRFASPRADSTVNGVTVFSATSTDENADILKYMYQIIPAKEFDAKQSATSSVNAWMTIGESAGNKFSWDSTEVEDGAYFVRIIVDDGLEKAYSEATRLTIRNTLPFFRFTHGRRTIAKEGPVAVSGRAIAPDLSPRPTITRVEYSIDLGKTWKIAAITGAGSTEASFNVLFPQDTEGVYPILWRARDSRNLYGRTVHEIVIDATPPQAPRITSPRVGMIVSSVQDEDTIQDGIQVSLSGTAEPSSTIALTVASSSRSVVASVDGTFVFRGVTLQHGENRFALRATDVAGNQSSSVDVAIVQDDAPEILILEPKSGHGLAGNARISWRVTDPDGDPVRVTLQYRRGNGAFVRLPVATDATSFQWDLSGFAEGKNYELVLMADDAIATSSESIGFSIDTTPPVLTTLSLTDDRIGANGSFKASGEASDALSGVAYVEYALREKGTSDEETEWLLSTITRGFLTSRATYAIARATRLEDGTFELVARAVDASGNVSPALSREIIVDTSPPHIGGFGLIEGNIRVSPDERGALMTYAGRAARFAISLESDTADAEVHIDSTIIPLSLNIATGLWEGDLPAIENEELLRVSVIDGLGNATHEKEIGTLEPITRGSVHDAEGGALSGVPIGIFEYDDARHAYIASGTIVHTAPDGSYELMLSPGKYELRARLQGYRTASYEISLDRPSYVNPNLTLDAYEGVAGFFERVLDLVRDR
jgi:hypothetical protein